MTQEIETIDCDIADQFMDELRPDHPRWAGSPYEHWIFRGQADPWPLRPTSLRASAANYRTALDREGGSSSLGKMPQWLEYGLLKMFLEAADDQGLQVPGDSAVARATVLSFSSWIEAHNPGRGDPFRWPPDDLLPMLALAQHHGLPTRLLDWSRSSFIAASDAAKASALLGTANVDAKRLVVWALNAAAVTSPRAPAIRVGDRDEALQLVDVPTGLNTNLAAQRGVFTLLRAMTPDGPPLESLLPAARLRRVTLPWSEATIAMFRLHLYRVDGGTVFPGHAGAVKRCHELTLMRRG